jgi:hypothetical protein
MQSLMVAQEMTSSGAGVYVCSNCHVPARPAAEAGNSSETPTIESVATTIPATVSTHAALQRSQCARTDRRRPPTSEPRSM